MAGYGARYFFTPSLERWAHLWAAPLGCVHGAGTERQRMLQRLRTARVQEAWPGLDYVTTECGPSFAHASELRIPCRPGAVYGLLPLWTPPLRRRDKPQTLSFRERRTMEAAAGRANPGRISSSPDEDGTSPVAARPPLLRRLESAVPDPSGAASSGDRASQRRLRRDRLQPPAPLRGTIQQQLRGLDAILAAWVGM